MGYKSTDMLTQVGQSSCFFSDILEKLHFLPSSECSQIPVTDVQYTFAVMLAVSGAVETAVSFCKKRLADNLYDTKIHWLLCCVFYSMRDYDRGVKETLQLYTKTIKLRFSEGPTQEDVIKLLALFFLRLQKWQEAKDLLVNANLGVWGVFWQSLCEAQQGKPERALSLLHEAQKNFDVNSSAYTSIKGRIEQLAIEYSRDLPEHVGTEKQNSPHTTSQGKSCEHSKCFVEEFYIQTPTFDPFFQLVLYPDMFSSGESPLILCRETGTTPQKVACLVCPPQQADLFKAVLDRNKSAFANTVLPLDMVAMYGQLALLYKSAGQDAKAQYMLRLGKHLETRQERSDADIWGGVANLPYVEKFKQALQTGGIDRSHVRKTWQKGTPLKVTFFASMGDMRVVRLAVAAKSAGIKVQLIICHTTEQRNSMIDETVFDEVIWFHSLLYELQQILVAIRQFGSHLIHCHMQLNSNDMGVWLLCACDIPVIGDAYDMVNVQYRPEYEGNKRWLPQQTCWEKIWYENCEGVCFRSPYKRFMEQKGILLKNNSYYIHLPEPLLSTKKRKIFTRKKKQPTILFYYTIPGMINFLNEIHYFLKKFNFRTLLLNYQNRSIKGLHEYFTCLPNLPYSEYCQLLQQVDIAWIGQLSLMREDNEFDNILYSFANKVVDLFEYGLNILIHEERKYINSYYKKANSFFIYNDVSIKTDNFWKDVLQRLNKQQKEFPKIFYTHAAGKKIYDFYVKILEN